MRAVGFCIDEDIEPIERRINGVLDSDQDESWRDEIRECFEHILWVALRSVSLSPSFDGISFWNTERNDPAEVTIFFEAHWFDSGFGNWIRLDVSQRHYPLLYSFKFFECEDMREQRLYLAKNMDGWVVSPDPR